MKHRALFVGLTTIDIQYFVDEFPEQNRKIKTKPPELFVGGPATNAAVAFAKLNNGVFLASPVGKNAFKLFVQEDFKQTHISHFDLAKNQSVDPVIASVITTLKNGDRNIFTHNPELNQFDYSAEKLFETLQPEIILLDGFFPEIAISVAKIAQKKKVPVVMDCGSWKPRYETLLNFTNVVICSSDFYPPDCTKPEHVFTYLQNKKVKQIAISRGERNIHFYEKEMGQVQVKEIETIDTLGAGDFLHGAFCYYFLESNNFTKALLQASELATFTCKFKGTRRWLNYI